MSNDTLTKTLYVIFGIVVVWYNLELRNECRRNGGGEYEHGRFAITYCQ